ncbi:MAG: ubiquitin-like small modifier protein 1 [Methanohalobium sp.]|uniref:ubiquitin-like small modifier protein 1 n=1 Tax=Methanohalobium sp. TaxID=2837493 RepID=UPI00397DA929
MVNVKVKLFANLREYAGVSEVILKGSTVSDILNSLGHHYPQLKELIFENPEDEDELQGYINVLLNGENIQHLEGLSTQLKEHDEIAILPPVSGG